MITKNQWHDVCELVRKALYAGKVYYGYEKKQVQKVDDDVIYCFPDEYEMVLRRRVVLKHPMSLTRGQGIKHVKSRFKVEMDLDDFEKYFNMR